MSQWQGPPSGPDPQDPYGNNPYGPPPQGPYGPEQQGQGQYGPGPGPVPGQAPGYGPGPQGPYGPNPYGAPQQQYPPPPRSSNAGIFWVIGIVAAVAVIGVVVTAAVLLSSDGKPDPARTLSLPTVTTLPTAPTGPAFTPNPYTPLPTAPAGPSDLSGVLTSTVKTALRGTTYTRVTTRGGSCTANANAALRKVLKAHPCAAPVDAALYTNPGRSVRVSIYIMQFDSSTDARAISTATNSQASPPLISPPRSGVGYWTLSRTQGSRVVYAVACRTDGGAAGSSTGTVNSAARELGVEIANVLLFKT